MTCAAVAESPASKSVCPIGVRYSILTKLIATVGPATSSREVIERLLHAGVSIFRFNFSHGSMEQHEERLRVIRDVGMKLGIPAAVLGDLRGPRIRLGVVKSKALELVEGQTVIVQRASIEADTPAPGEGVRFSTTLPGMIDDVQPGHRVLINDGSVRMLVVSKSRDAFTCSVTMGGPVSSGKGMNLPDTVLNVPALTDDDRENVAWAIEHGLDMLALSFVRSADDVRLLRDAMRTASHSAREHAGLPTIIAKIETPRALENISAIVDASDGIMIARGDLGVEMDLAMVPVIQKRLIAASQDYGKPCIVATQMLESMIERPAPTRAEASDVAGAIFDMADAVMLSGETAVGKYPVLAVEHMRRIAERTEAHLAGLPAAATPPRVLVELRYHAAALAHGVWTIAQDLGAKCVVVWSQSGGGARYLSQNNFHIPIIAVTSNERVARQMQILRCVMPVHMEAPCDLDAWTKRMDEFLRARGWATPGETVILMAGEPLGRARATNRLAIHVVGNPSSGFAAGHL